MKPLDLSFGLHNSNIITANTCRLSVVWYGVMWDNVVWVWTEERTSPLTMEPPENELWYSVVWCGMGGLKVGQL
jgi:hypothetical protein